MLLLAAAPIAFHNTAEAGPRRIKEDGVEEAQDPIGSIIKERRMKFNFMGKNAYPDTPDLKAGSNLRKFFFASKFPKIAIDWLSPSGSRITWKDTSYDYQETHISVESVALDRENRKSFKITVLVPHPVYLPMVESGLVEEFANLQPPALKVTSAENLLIHDFKASAYIHTTEYCSVVFHIAHGTLLEIRSMEECGNLSAIRAVIEELDIVRLDQRLQS